MLKHLELPLLLLWTLIPASQAQDKPCGRQDADAVVAIVGDRQITLGEVDGLLGNQSSSLKERLYELRQKALEGYIDAMLLEGEAKKQHTTPRSLHKAIITSVNVSDEEVESEYERTVAQYGAPPIPELEAKEKIRAKLETDKRLQALHQVTSMLRCWPVSWTIWR